MRRRLKKARTRPPLPSIILSNVRSLRPKAPNTTFDELQANVVFRSEFREACVLCFAETWFSENISDDSVAIDGFGSPFRCERDCDVTGKKRGGGVCMYINEAWCPRGNVTVRKHLNTCDVDLLSLSFRPCYLPREFGQVFVTGVYIPPWACQARAAQQVADTVRELQLLSADAPNFVVGDFNNTELRPYLATYEQYFTCPTRQDKTIDLCYGNIPRAFRSFALPPIGNSDHKTVHLVPAYRPRVKTERVVKKHVRVWSPECVSELQGCFDCTDWDVLIRASESVNEATDVISSYINFCEDMLIPTKMVKIYPNNKPWITKALKKTINEKKIAFQSKQDRKAVQKRLNKQIRDAKRAYKEKVETQFQSGSIADAWKGLKQLTGQSKSKLVSNLPSEEKMAFSEKLNEFYCRYERNDVKENLYETIEELKAKGLEEGECDEVERSFVESTFRRLKIRKAAGPDNISARLLKTCASQLSYAFCKLFNWSLNDSTVPSIWKHSVICPVPKNNKPSTLNDYRPVALTSVVMKCFEKVVLSRLVPRIQPHADPLQFAYKRDRGTDDATLTLLHHAFTHLDHKGSFVRILFIDFSSAFNTIQPHVLAHKLTQVGVNAKLVLWIVNFLVERAQKVHFQNFVSSSMTTSTGSPQGTVLSPFFFFFFLFVRAVY